MRYKGIIIRQQSKQEKSIFRSILKAMIQVVPERIKINLGAIARNISLNDHPTTNTVACIVTDATRPLYREKENNYIVMVKVVDESLNDANIFGVMCRDCTVFLISDCKEELEIVSAIGEIVVLDKFTFHLWNRIKLETKYLKMVQGFYVIAFNETDSMQDKGSQQRKVSIKRQLSENSQLFELNRLQIDRLHELKAWRDLQMASFHKPTIGISILNAHFTTVEPFNMFLKVQQIETIKLQDLKKTAKTQHRLILHLTDSNNNKFHINVINIGNFTINEILYVRGIHYISKSEQSYELNLTQTGNILHIEYPIKAQRMNYMAIYKYTQNADWHKKLNQFTKISASTGEVTFLCELLQLQDKYFYSSKKEDISIRDTYYLQAVALNFHGKLSLYHREHQILLDDSFFEQLTEEEKRESKDYNRIIHIFQGAIGLIDRSSESKKKIFFAYLFNCDASGSFIDSQQFEKVDRALGTPNYSDIRNHLDSTITTKLNCVTQLSNFQKPVSLVVEPIRSQKLLFRIINTKFA